MEMQYRPYYISCGLREGYSTSAITHTLEEARTCIEEWMVKRLKDKKKIVTGILLPGEFIYPLISNEGINSSHEPAFHYKGVVREDATDSEAIEMLQDLGKKLLMTLGQERLHIRYKTQYQILEK